MKAAGLTKGETKMTTFSEIKKVCKENQCPLTEKQLAHIGNVIYRQENEAKSIIRALLGAHLEQAWKPWPRLVKLAENFSDHLA